MTALATSQPASTAAARAPSAQERALAAQESRAAADTANRAAAAERARVAEAANLAQQAALAAAKAARKMRTDVFVIRFDSFKWQQVNEITLRQYSVRTHRKQQQQL